MTWGSEYHSNFAAVRASAAAALGRPNGSGVGQSGLFDRLDWFEALHGACLSDLEPLIGHASDDSGHSAWLFMTRKGRSVFALANFYSFAWRPLWCGGPDDTKKIALLATLASSLKSHGAKLWLSSIPIEDGSAEALANALRSAGWIVACEATSHNHWLDTQGRAFAEWWAMRPGALRSTVQRKGKKGLVALTITGQFNDADWDDYERVYRQSWKPPEGFPGFLRDWAKGEAVTGTLRLGLARIDGIVVAAQFWSCDNGVAYIHKLAHVAGHDAFSPGTLLTHALFAHAFDVDKVSRIDFGTGDDGYKRDWMEDSAALMTIRAWDPHQPTAWPSLARHYLTRLAAKALGR
ncbi:MAG: GNAT family N-acetyltransferase [Pseudomonadota bacterium]